MAEFTLNHVFIHVNNKISEKNANWFIRSFLDMSKPKYIFVKYCCKCITVSGFLYIYHINNFVWFQSPVKARR